jgi:glycosyltransferase involved in cell wall biosynthesis
MQWRLMSSGSSSPFRDRAAHSLAGATVLQIIPDLRQGPTASAAIDVAGALGRLGGKALVASRGGDLISELQAKGGIFLPFPADARNPFSMALNVRRLAQLIKTERVDIVHARSRAPAWVAYGATRLVKTPFVTSYQGSYGRGGPLALRYNSVMARGDAIIADSAHTAERIATLYPYAKEKIAVVIGGVDCRIFAPKAVAPVRVQAMRRLWRVAADERVVLLVVGARASSGYRTAIEAVKILAGRGGEGALAGVKIIIDGEEQSGGFAQGIDAAIGKAGLQHLMRRGEIGDRPAALLAASAVVALPANPETFASLALEAQAMGAPVIVPAVGAASETVLAAPEVDQSARTGWRAPALDTEALANAVSEALSLGATARDRLSLRARTHVETLFSIEQMRTQTLGAYAAARRDRQ